MSKLGDKAGRRGEKKSQPWSAWVVALLSWWFLVCVCWSSPCLGGFDLGKWTRILKSALTLFWNEHLAFLIAIWFESVKQYFMMHCLKVNFKKKCSLTLIFSVFLAGCSCCSRASTFSTPPATTTIQWCFKESWETAKMEEPSFSCCFRYATRLWGWCWQTYFTTRFCQALSKAQNCLCKWSRCSTKERDWGKQPEMKDRGGGVGCVFSFCLTAVHCMKYSASYCQLLKYTK